MAEPRIPPGFDFTDPDLNAIRVPAEELAELRRTAPVWWNAQPHGASGFDDDGYWVVTRHADVLHVSRHSELYSSEANTALNQLRTVNDQIVQLSRRNTNVRSLALALGQLHMLRAKCEAALQALSDSLSQHEFKATR